MVGKWDLCTAIAVVHACKNTIRTMNGMRHGCCCWHCCYCCFKNVMCARVKTYLTIIWTLCCRFVVFFLFFPIFSLLPLNICHVTEAQLKSKQWECSKIIPKSMVILFKILNNTLKSHKFVRIKCVWWEWGECVSAWVTVVY